MKKVQFKIGCGFALLSCLCNTNANAQAIYIDPITAGAMAGVNLTLKNGQQKQEKELNKLQKAQAWVGTQLGYANHIQDKVYEGLSQVSGLVSNGIQAKNIISEFSQCYKILGEIKKMGAENPEYTIFAVKATQSAYEQIPMFVSFIARVKEGGKDNLMSAGDRYRLLDEFHSRIVQFKIRLYVVHIAMERAIRIGFWKSINPFQGYINTDKNIVDNIIWKYKHLI